MVESTTDKNMQERYELLQQRMADACARSGRAVSEVNVVAVSKTFGPEAVREAVDCGLHVFGENKVQEARSKISMCPGSISWHLVGHLQSNKVNHAVRLFEAIHSIDSINILRAVDAACDQVGRTLQAMIQVNVSGEPSKFGLPPEELSRILEVTSDLKRVDVVGLMTIPPFTEDVEETRPYFAALRELRDQAPVPLQELSMGMTNDFEVAIEEGATYVRIGTALFGRRGKK